VNGHEDWLACTGPMLVLLRLASERRVTGWDAGSTTVGACKRSGFLKRVKVTTELFGHRSTRTEYELTEAGRRALEGGR
jgi:hypothetical protein